MISAYRTPHSRTSDSISQCYLEKHQGKRSVCVATIKISRLDVPFVDVQNDTSDYSDIRTVSVGTQRDCGVRDQENKDAERR